MRTRVHVGRTKFLLLTVVLPRAAGVLVPALLYLESNGFRVDVNALYVRVASGVIGLLLLYTPTGRRLLLIGWLFMLAVILANLKYIEFSWETVKLLGFWLALGALWFVNWVRLAGKINRPKPTRTPSARRRVRGQLIRESAARYM